MKPTSPAAATRTRLVAGVLASMLALAPPTVAPARAQRATDSSFAALVARLSENAGYFDSDNIISNEESYLEITTQLTKIGTHGGAYIGVGPDQNFSYVALIRPSIAFMLDIRRDNLLEHLYFKSLFALSRNRTEFLCRLFGKPVPSDIEKWTGRQIGPVLAYLDRAPNDSAAAAETRRLINERIASYGVPLDSRDRAMIDRYRGEFIADGLDTRYSSIGRNNRLDYPTFRQLMLATDRNGRAASYLAEEEPFQFVRSMEARDLIVPVVGNVAGDKAVKAIGQYATEHHLTISAFYLSNVEQYLLGRDGGFDEYARNVVALPRDTASVIIRSYFGRLGMVHPLYVPGPGNISTSMIETMDSFAKRYTGGELRGYADLVFGGYVKP